MSAKNAGLALALFLTALLAAPNLYAQCIGPTPEANLTMETAPPECLQIEAQVIPGTAMLAIANNCDEAATVEQVNCTNCDDSSLEVPGDNSGTIEVESEPGQTISSDFTWSHAGETGSFSVETVTPEGEDCDEDTTGAGDGDNTGGDTGVADGDNTGGNNTGGESDGGDDGCSTTGNSLPASGLALLAFGLVLIGRRKRIEQ